MKKSMKNLVLAGLVLLAIVMVLVGCDTNAGTVQHEHTGGTATCISKAKCSECGAEYGEYNGNNHEQEEVGDSTHIKTHLCCESVEIDGTLGGKTEATEEEVNALVEKLKAYVDNGLNTIIVTGSEPAMINWYYKTVPAYARAICLLTYDPDEMSKYFGTIDLIIPDVTEIVDFEFEAADALNSVTLPKVTTVGDGAFYATQYLKKLTFGSVITFVNEKSSGPFHMDGYKVGGCDLVLNCGQLQAEDKYKPNFETNVWFIGDWSGEYEWKSITLK